MEKRTIALLAVIALIVCAILYIESGSSNKNEPNAQSSGNRIGDYAPDFTLQTVDGKSISLQSLQGKPLILNFFASWCPPCREEMPEFENVFLQGNIQVIGVNLQEDKENVDSFAKKLSITFPLLLDPNAQVKASYGVLTQPVTYFIDANGLIVDKKLGPLTHEEIEQKSASLFESSNPKDSIQTAQRKNEQSKVNLKYLKDGTPYLIHPDELVAGGPPKDGIPSIDNPQFISIKEANEWLTDDELVMGIERNGISKAYPFQIMVWHELVNDYLGDEPILISYCPLCATTIAFKRELNGEAVEFGVSGKLYDSDMVMYDRESDSYWQQATGVSIIGTYAGERLEMVKSDVATWGDWKKAYPQTMVLSQNTGFNRDYGRDPYTGYYSSSSLIFDVPYEDERLHPKDIVYGIIIDSIAKAYPDDLLMRESTIIDTVANKEIIISKDENGIVAIVDENGSPIIPTRAFWFAWATFNPDTMLYSKA